PPNGRLDYNGSREITLLFRQLTDREKESPMLKLIKKLSLLFSALCCAQASAQSDFLPAPLLELDDLFAHHVLVAEKSTHQLHLFQNDNGYPKLVKTVQMATGKKAGDKLFQG